ncbi:MAG: hypothetical protein WAW81_02170, partial [Minisyncoccia bacterium]
AKAWWFFTIAWSITSISTFVYHGGFTLSMVMPVVMTVAHLAVALLCLESRKNSWLKERGIELAHIELKLLELDGGASKLRHLVQQPSWQTNKLLGATGFALYAFNQERERLTQRKMELEKLGIT